MTAERWKRIKTIFDSALEVRPEERVAFILNPAVEGRASGR
ncbi:MAG TPA: hypothetical protein VKV17_09390 [Bryobacteraceae bacterium]|nr:hypothetical protein [Bryobacteraceae bacterium]